MIGLGDIGLIFQIAAIAIITTIFYTFLKQAGREEYAYLSVVAALAIVLIQVIPVIIRLFQEVKEVFRIY
ncbi:stage III sporulation protein AC [Zhaonella formicivorans]|uniref:stage III sporulation protein AC n=1 Tax=Zhaonella formicivorans TaxID=2528593 RepID=UPI0010D232C3|nr:stage III sporulation protein AC [Zhaonella formicivorans]